jgi:PST family polysaccharide transporter
MLSRLLSKIRHPLVANSFYLYMAYFADYLLALIILPFIARVLGPEELGYLGLVQTFGLFILLIMEFGFPLMATREIAKNKNDQVKTKKLIGEVFTFKLFLIPVLLVISTIAILTVPVFHKNPYYVIIVVIGSIFQGMAPTWYFQGVEKLSIIAFSKTIFRILGFSLIFIFVRSNDDGWIVLLGYMISSICICLYLIKYMVNIIGSFPFAGRFSIKAIWRKSKHSFFITIFPVIYNNIIVFVLSLVVSPIQLGYYYGATRIYRAFNTLYGPIGQAFYPRLVSTNSGDSEKAINMARLFFWILLAVGVSFFIILYFFAKPIILILLGKEFLFAVPILKLFAIVLPLTAISHVLGRQWLMIRGNDKQYFKIIFIASLLGIISIIILVKSYGILSMPISLILYELVTVLLILGFLKRTK